MVFRLNYLTFVGKGQSVLRPILVKHFHVAKCMAASKALDDAKSRVGTLAQDPGNDAKLRLYALYKQATVGPCNTKKPGVFDFVGQAKWTAWNSLGQMSTVDAEKEYVAYVNQLAGGSASPAAPEVKPVSAGNPVVEGLDVKFENGICSLTFNRPKKLNAITTTMYKSMTEALSKAGEDPTIKAALITGAGDYYCSGNDLSNFTQIPPEGPKKLALESRELLRKFVASFINFPKPLICAVNGPAVGISVTVLGLADLVYASDKATFHTPFMTLGQSPEGCSSYTFPRIMGYARANEVLLAGRKLTAKEAFDRGLVTDVIPHSDFYRVVNEKVQFIANLPPKSLLYAKALSRSREKEVLERVNEEECLRLEERWLSEECMNAVMAFLSKRSKM